MKTMFRALGALALLFVSHAATAQTSFNFYNGFVPTPAQWNSYFQKKQDTFPNQSANTVFAGPPSGSGLPTFRLLGSLDLPVVPVTKGGTGLTSIARGSVLYGSAPNTIGPVGQFKFSTGNLGIDLALIGGARTTLVITEPQTLSGNAGVAENVTLTFAAGGSITSVAGADLSMSGVLDAGRREIFLGFTSGKLHLNYPQRLFPEWTGQAADGNTSNATGTDNCSKMQVLLSAAAIGSTVVWRDGGIYNYSCEIRAPGTPARAVNFISDGFATLQFTDPASYGVRLYGDLNAVMTRPVVKNLYIRRATGVTPTAGGGAGLDLYYTALATIENLQIENFFVQQQMQHAVNTTSRRVFGSFLYDIDGAVGLRLDQNDAVGGTGQFGSASSLFYDSSYGCDQACLQNPTFRGVHVFGPTMTDLLFVDVVGNGAVGFDFDFSQAIYKNPYTATQSDIFLFYSFPHAFTRKGIFVHGLPTPDLRSHLLIYGVWIDPAVSSFNPVTISNASPAVVTQANHRLVYNDPVVFSLSTGARFTGYISGTSLVVTSIASGSLSAGNLLYGQGVTPGTTIVSGPGGAGTYVVSTSQTVGSVGSPVSNMTVTGVLPTGITAGQRYYVTTTTTNTYSLSTTYGANTPVVTSSAGSPGYSAAVQTIGLHVDNFSGLSLIGGEILNSSNGQAGSGVLLTGNNRFLHLNGTKITDQKYGLLSAQGLTYDSTLQSRFGNSENSTFTASITGTVMDVTAIASGAINNGEDVIGASAGTFVQSFIAGTGTAGGVGKYLVSQGQYVASGTLKTAHVAVAQFSAQGGDFIRTNLLGSNFAGYANLGIGYPTGSFQNSLTAVTMDTQFITTPLSDLSTSGNYYGCNPGLPAPQCVSGPALGGITVGQIPIWASAMGRLGNGLPVTVLGTALLAMSSQTANGVLLGNGTSAFSNTGVGAANTVLRGTGAAPAFGKVDLTADVTGVLPIANGGSGIASGTSGGIPYYSSASTLASSALLVANRLVLGGGAGTAPATLGSSGTLTTVLHGNAGGAPTFAAVDLVNDVTNRLAAGNFRQSGALSVVGNATNATADAADITASTDNQVLRRSGTSLGFGAVNLASAAAVTGTLGTANGGTGSATAPTNGQLAVGQTGTGYAPTTITGDIALTAGGSMTLNTAQASVHTWALAQTFTVAPIFTDQSGSRTALGLGTVATQNANAVNFTGGALSGTYTGTPAFSGSNFITLANIVTQGAATLTGNPTAGSATPTAFTIQGLTARGAPDATNDRILIWDAAAGTLKYVSPAQVAASATAGVSSIAGNTGAFTLAGLLTNSANVLQVTAASKAIMQAASSTTTAVTPAQTQNHPGVVKAWARITWSGTTPTLASGYNVTSVAYGGSTGSLTFSFPTPFLSTTDYVCQATSQASSTNIITDVFSPTSASAAGFLHYENGVVANPLATYFQCFGTQ